MTIKLKLSALILSLLLCGCGGGGGGSSESGSAVKPLEKEERAALSAQDLSLTFSERGIATPQVHHQVGDTVFSISDGEPEDVIAIDPNTGLITILAAGETQVTVVDSSREYKTSTAKFNVVVEKAVNNALELSDFTLPTLSNKEILLPFLGSKGDVSVEFRPEGLVSFDPKTGIISAVGIPGEVEVIVTDSGDRNYRETIKSSTISIEALAPDSLVFSSLERPFKTGLTLSPIQVGGPDGGRFQYELVEGDEADPVISVSADSGLITVLKVGEAKVKATQYLGDEYGNARQEAYFNVRIGLGQRADLSVEDTVLLFDRSELFTPAVNNNIAPVRYEILSGEDVVEVDAQTGLLRMLGVGQAEVKAIDDLDANYAAEERQFKVSVAPAVHPGIKAGEVTYTYSQAKLVTPTLEGQIGDLSLSGDTNVVSLNGNKLTVLRAGVAKLTAIDDGGDNFQPSAPALLTVNVLKAPHPGFTVSNLTTTYSPDRCEQASFEAQVGALLVTPVSGNDSDIAEYDSARDCFLLKRSGIANFNVVREESENYFASEPKRMSVVIHAADSRLLVGDDLSRTFTAGQPIVHAPAVSGGTGNLSFKLLEEKSESGVIAVNESNGDITILNAGHAVVEVSDAGDELYGPATTSFAVKIDKAVNPVTVTYPDTVYSQDGEIIPTIENLKGTISFRVYEADTSPVTVTSTGTVKMHSTGSFFVYFDAAESRNYLAASGYAGAFIDKAEHPGFAVRRDALEYEPLKKVTLDLAAEYGARSYSLQSVTGGWVGQYLSVEPNTGELSLLDYAPSTSFSLQVSEQESEFYKPVGPVLASFMSVVPPAKGKASRDVSLSNVFNVLESTIDDSKTPYHETELRFAGAKVMQPTMEEIQKLGVGKALSVDVISAEPIGDTGHQRVETVRIYVQRYEGCATSVNILNLAELAAQKQALPLHKSNYCLFGPTNRLVTYTVVDKSLIDRYDFYDGEWDTVQPFVIYRTADMPSEETGYIEEQVIEWDRVELKLTRD
ncbi:cadherin repeat domain-containing protein [Photobacterium rosenbergii]|uniref:Cadherin repeat domain-containing protein n=1 Tax=Photobacterium rosenbergii TaxID=294936 RepID=A0ABU3ZJI6_9GAMM|nr:cadherin repeat domain-containing protein [Photobacterium rosenbergii]MDV5170269.1 cadherin repeat domain-containing protein [Photobacterium rosenbergii]